MARRDKHVTEGIGSLRPSTRAGDDARPSYTKAAIGLPMFGDAATVAEHVR